jgi:hypothetical protein
MPYQSIPLFVMNGERPPIPEGVPSTIVNLISQCWDHNPSNRPEASSIIDMLNKCDSTLEDAPSPPPEKAQEIVTKDQNIASLSDIEQVVQEQNLTLIDKSALENMEVVKAGTQGIVYTAIYNRQVVAVKKFAAYRQSFRREVFIMSKVSHRNILKLIGNNSLSPYSSRTTI